MKILDLTRPIFNGMPGYFGDPPVNVWHVSEIRLGAQANVSAFSMSCHAGTHVDSPYHLLPDGHTVDSLPLDTLIGDALVLAISTDGLITPAILESAGYVAGVERLLIDTGWRWSETGVLSDYPYIDEQTAIWLFEHGLKLIGIDTPSIDAVNDESLAAHHRLLENGVVVVEGLDMTDIKPGCYMLTCLPLKLLGADGAPARVIITSDAK